MTKPPRGLSSSVWAGASSQRTQSLPPPLPASEELPSPSSPRAKALARAQALRRFEQVCVRLRWKFIDLQNAYDRTNAPQSFHFAAQEAENNFKVDFHEFYVKIEQAIVFLLKLFGTTIAKASTLATTQYGGAPSVAAAHAYHHNVLKALDDDQHPLHEPLGKGPVNQALWKAKELRNKWKSATEDRESPPLGMYDLSWIVNQVLAGLEAAYAVASARVIEDLNDNDLAMTDDERRDAAVVEGEWEWMVEPMDWES
ncbi:MAG TPA: hypothetical protein PLE48_09915 [Thiobacillus sp.]|uniref:Fungal specific transcription factor n=1 Tax=Purpureocillium lilacinum TaxID=33203 RepID=A0A179GCE5_PURLI|nr:fungal specific transcription factor [Purpureocillium lilacinum]HQT70729.1 hypothetical protein [Thiobacillus sp.]KAK4091762.1 hypothetical protein Purlil1_4192 [Purpureocillium lilacinum]OAQ75093.1 fungal specific transcription factor [Purpureocillium lilacinum]OAQ80724.1 fungal specific transcription factor [Purpureocillium lilacinum]PWI75496.1 hypothetical protein PCL_06154 [Purpureocillium lilacinum]